MSRYSNSMKEIISDTIRQNIHSAAIEVIHEQGWNAFTMDRIAEKMGVSRGLLYNYFENKEEIARFIIENAFDEIIKKLTQIADTKKTASERLLEMSILEVHEFLKQKELHRTLMENIRPPQNCQGIPKPIKKKQSL